MGTTLDLRGATRPILSCVSPLLEAFWPQQRHLHVCEECGDLFESTYRLGCFGPVGGQVRHIKSSWGLLGRIQLRLQADTILCAHCGHEPWHSREQRLLRKGLRLQEGWTKLLDAEVGEGLGRVAEAQVNAWVAGLELDHFRQLAPGWFAALWEGGPLPASRLSMPKEAKKARFFLHKVARVEAMTQWPERPAFPKEVLSRLPEGWEAWRKQADRLVPGLQALGRTRALRRRGFGLLPFDAAGSRSTHPDRGATAYCYDWAEGSGQDLAQRLSDLGRLRDLSAYAPAPPRLELTSPLLLERLKALLRAHRLSTAF